MSSRGVRRMERRVIVVMCLSNFITIMMLWITTEPCAGAAWKGMYLVVCG